MLLRTVPLELRRPELSSAVARLRPPWGLIQEREWNKLISKEAPALLFSKVKCKILL
jgi:hypothetical protein